MKKKKLDLRIDEFWDYDFKFTWQDYEGQEHECLLKDTYFFYN